MLLLFVTLLQLFTQPIHQPVHKVIPCRLQQFALLIEGEAQKPDKRLYSDLLSAADQGEPGLSLEWKGVGLFGFFKAEETVPAERLMRLPISNGKSWMPVLSRNSVMVLMLLII